MQTLNKRSKFIQINPSKVYASKYSLDGSTITCFFFTITFQKRNTYVVYLYNACLFWNYVAYNTCGYIRWCPLQHMGFFFHTSATQLQVLDMTSQAIFKLTDFDFSGLAGRPSVVDLRDVDPLSHVAGNVEA